MKANFYCRKKQNLLKRGLLSLVFALVTFATTAQVGIGTSNPNSSSQLHIVAEDKGIIIPQVSLTHSTDTTTITNGNVESLLVYNINALNDVFPGYYYWSNNRWNRIVSPSDGTGQLTLSPGDILDYINLDGTPSSIDLGGIALSNQAITELIDNGDGTITYINELGLSTTIDLAAGSAGLSAYQIAVNNGFSGTEAQWLTSLQGANGADGATGQDGIDGLSAYQIAVNNGFTGTEAEWLASLQGSDANIWLVDGTNTTVESVTSDAGTEWKVNVPTANGTTLGVVKEAETNPTVKVDAQGTLSVNLENLNDVKEISGTYQVQLTDAVLLGNASTADVTVILPAPQNNKGKTFTIKKQDANEDYYVNVYGNISGLPSNQLYTALPYSGWVLVSDGTQWRITNKF
jgi:hypothetical protein